MKVIDIKEYHGKQRTIFKPGIWPVQDDLFYGFFTVEPNHCFNLTRTKIANAVHNAFPAESY